MMAVFESHLPMGNICATFFIEVYTERHKSAGYFPFGGNSGALFSHRGGTK